MFSLRCGYRDLASIKLHSLDELVAFARWENGTDLQVLLKLSCLVILAYKSHELLRFLSNMLIHECLSKQIIKQRNVKKGCAGH